jgi:hypothetical protein
MPMLIAPALAGGLGLSASASSLVAGLIFTVGSTLLSFLLAPKPDVPAGTIPFKQPIPPRGFGYGRTRVTGNQGTMLLEAAGGNGGKLLNVQALLSHPCHAFVDYYLHEDRVTLTGDLIANTDGSKKYGGDKVHAFTRLGAVPETAIAEMTGAQITDSPWTSAHRGDGITYFGFVFSDADEDSQAKKFPFGRPIPSAVLDAALLYDPRDAAQDPDDDSTWVWSDNPVLAILHFLCFSEFGYQRDYATAILPHVASWEAAADHCDGLVALDAGGSEKRYRLGGNATTETSPRAVLGQMLATCDGWLVDRGDGGIDIRVGVFEEPDIILTDDDIVGFDIPYGVADEEAVNRLDITFTDSQNKYVETEVDPWQDEADQAARGALREHRFELSWVQSWTQARRLGKREFTRLQEPLRGTLDLRLEAIDACYQRWIRVQSATIPQLADIVIENRKAHLSLLAGAVRIGFLGSGAAIDDWTPATDEGTAPSAPAAPANQELPEPANVVIDYIEYSEVLEGGSVTILHRALRVVFDEHPNTYRYVVKWSWTAQLPDGPVAQTDSETISTFASAAGRTTLLTSKTIPEVAALSVQVATQSMTGSSLSDYAPDPAAVLDTRTVTSTAADGYELREDGTVELREDGAREVRETDA